MIWFRNLKTYLLDDVALSASEIDDKLSARPFQEPGASDAYSMGWVPPSASAPDVFAWAAQNTVLVALRIDEKNLPGSAVKLEVKKRVTQIEAEETRKVGRSEAKEIKERVIAEMLPRALIKSRTLRALIDLERNYIYVDSGSSGQAENLLSYLRETIGDLPTRLVSTKLSPQTAMTMWLTDGAPDDFDLADECELKFPGENGAIARFTRQALETEEVRQNLSTGKLATKLGLSWDERISFVLTDELSINKLKMLDVLSEELESADAGDKQALFDTELALLIGELRNFIPALINALGGIEK